jgi:hypothetical protein
MVASAAASNRRRSSVRRTLLAAILAAGADVAYAGGASAQIETAPRPAETSVEIKPLVTLELRVNERPLEATIPTDFHIRANEAAVAGAAWAGRGLGTWAGDAAGYEHICTAPCEATLPAGTYRLALSQGGGMPVEPRNAVTIERSSLLYGTYTSRKVLRTIGWVVLGAIILGGTALMFPAVQSGQSSPVLADGAFMMLGSLIGLMLAFERDRAHIYAVTLDPALDSAALRSPLLSRREGALFTPDGAGAQGLALRARF